MTAWALEAEYEHELEDEYEFEDEAEAEAEAEEFIGWVKKVWNKPAFKKARVYGRIIGELFRGPTAHDGQIEKPVPTIPTPGPYQPGPTKDRKPRGGAGSKEAEYEHELEAEDEAETESALARFGRAAAMAANENEAEAFVGALAPLAARLAPAAARQWAAATPAMVQGLSRTAAYLRRDPATQPLVGVLPAAAARAARQAQVRARQGRPVSAPSLVSLVGHEAQRIVADPQRAAQVLRQVARGRTT